MIDDDGVDIGRTLGDVAQEIKEDVVTMLARPAGRIKRLDSEAHSVYWVGENILRVDIKVADLGR